MTQRDEQNAREFSHLDEAGRARMVDVAGKPVTPRRAVAGAVVRVGPGVYKRLADRSVPKGDVLTVAQIAGIQAAKRTSELIPLCHGLPLDYVDVRCTLRAPDAVDIRATATITAKTGVEMEALTAASIAALTIYDMCKALSKSIEIGPIRLLEKTGGKSGDYRRESSTPRAAPPVTSDIPDESGAANSDRRAPRTGKIGKRGLTGG